MGTKLNMDSNPISKLVTHKDSLSFSYFHFPVARPHYPFPDPCFRRVSMEWWLLRLSAKILALLRLSGNFFQLPG